MSTKLADYYITEVRYNPEHAHIVKVKLHPDSSGTVGSEYEWTRTDVVNALQNSKSFITILKNGTTQWRKGEDVRVVTINGTKYIRTDANSKDSDNLGNLPEF
jgi:hypothetical protein